MRRRLEVPQRLPDGYTSAAALSDGSIRVDLPKPVPDWSPALDELLGREGIPEHVTGPLAEHFGDPAMRLAHIRLTALPTGRGGTGPDDPARAMPSAEAMRDALLVRAVDTSVVALARTHDGHVVPLPVPGPGLPGPEQIVVVLRSAARHEPLPTFDDSRDHVAAHGHPFLSVRDTLEPDSGIEMPWATLVDLLTATNQNAERDALAPGQPAA